MWGSLLAKFPRGLCVILTIWLAVTRPSAANRTESPHSSAGWGIPEFEEIAREGPELRRRHAYAAQEELYQQGIAEARQRHHVPAEITYLTALANTYIWLYRYTEAITAYGDAARLARASGDWEAAGAIAPGLSSLYRLVGDLPAARAAIEDGAADVRHLSIQPYYHAQLMAQRARLHADDAGLGGAIVEAIEAARAQDEPLLEAQGWDLLGETRLGHGELAGAEQAIDAAFRLRQRTDRESLRLSYRTLGRLRLEQARAAPRPQRAALLTEARRFTRQAIADSERTGLLLDLRELVHQRGLIREAQGDADGALADFARAVEIGERWRLALPAADDALTAGNATLDRDVFRTFIEAAARRALHSGEIEWAARAFLANEENRAASLRQSLELAPVWRQKLPPDYWTKLASLREEEAAAQAGPSTPSPMLGRLHLALSEMETKAGLGFSPNPHENFLSQTSLIHFQRGLGDSELFLSFHLGVRESYLWTVSASAIRIHKLPPAAEIEAHVGAFRDSLRENVSEDREEGAGLYRMLFGGLSAEESGKPSWLLSLEGGLFELPFAALVVELEGAGGEWEYLVERHSLQEVPSALLLSRRPGVPEGRYLAVGDPIYNTADPRYRGEPWYKDWYKDWSGWWGFGEDRRGRDPLNRLPGTHAEVKASAAVWRAADGVGEAAVEILEGAAATRGRFLTALAGAAPGTIHLATHVLSGEASPQQASLALSLGPHQAPELLSAADIALTDAHGSLVLMTGCASGQGEIREGAGLLGLTRAWLVAGADTVVATLWPVPDAAGELAPAFYRHLPAASTAEALRQAQIEVIRSGTWQAAPSYWASYQVTGGVR